VRRCEDYDTEPGVWYHAHDLAAIRCHDEAIVGWGNPPRWVCRRHYEQALALVRQTIDRALRDA